jgi:type IV pilus assembly protein PilA
MLNRLQNKKDDEGFTLIELLVVVVIIGVLAAIAIPIFLSQKDKAAEAGVKSDIKNASTYLEALFVDTGSYANADAYLADEDTGYKASDENDITVTGDTEGYCIEGVGDTNNVFHLSSEDGAVEAGGCTTTP